MIQNLKKWSVVVQKVWILLCNNLNPLSLWGWPQSSSVQSSLTDLRKWTKCIWNCQKWHLKMSRYKIWHIFKFYELPFSYFGYVRIFLTSIFPAYYSSGSVYSICPSSSLEFDHIVHTTHTRLPKLFPKVGVLGLFPAFLDSLKHSKWGFINQ